jgi:hypothetical protein
MPKISGIDDYRNGRIRARDRSKFADGRVRRAVINEQMVIRDTGYAVKYPPGLLINSLNVFFFVIAGRDDCNMSHEKLKT